MLRNALLGLGLAIALVFVGAGCSSLNGLMDSAGEIGKIVDAPKLNTKEADALLKELDAINAELEDISGSINSSTEGVHAVIAPYKAGEFPVLTKNWDTINAELKKAKGKKKQQAQAQKKTYEQEMAARTVAAAAILENKDKRKALLGKLKAPELQQLKDAGQKLKAIPDRNTALAGRVPALIDRSVAVVADLTKQIVDNPLAALEGEKVLKKVNKSVAAVQKIPKEAKKQVKAVKALLKLLDDIL